MNRENKRKTFEKGYYKNHPCNDSFTCKVCGRLVTPDAAGTEHRNHCPNCLSSLHVDIEPGDREADCGGIMEPIAVWVRGKGEWAIIHRCRRCGALSSNRVAADDNPMKLMSIALKPLCEPPFPLERIEEMTALMGGEGRLKYPPVTGPDGAVMRRQALCLVQGAGDRFSANSSQVPYLLLSTAASFPAPTPRILRFAEGRRKPRQRSMDKKRPCRGNGRGLDGIIFDFRVPCGPCGPGCPARSGSHWRR